MLATLDIKGRLGGSVYQSQPFSLSFSMSLLHLANVFIIFLLFLYTYLFPSVSVY